MKKIILLAVIAILFSNGHTQAMQPDADEATRIVARKKWKKGVLEMGLGAASVGFIGWLDNNGVRHLSFGQSATKSTLKAGALILCAEGARNFGSGIYEEYERFRNRVPGVHPIAFRNICNGLVDLGLAFSIYGINTWCLDYLPSAYTMLYGHHQTQGIAILLGYRGYNTLKENIPDFGSDQDWGWGVQLICQAGSTLLSKAKSMVSSASSWISSFWNTPKVE
ncbi:MAG: hypothetical protein BGO67_11540 [Alphaproteobacteria bacterium 41-28]|nr:MAG: hypothetical protein BGO67_11540 [Alphaproteobacteria bacterium 41-28]